MHALRTMAVILDEHPEGSMRKIRKVILELSENQQQKRESSVQQMPIHQFFRTPN